MLKRAVQLDNSFFFFFFGLKFTDDSLFVAELFKQSNLLLTRDILDLHHKAIVSLGKFFL